MTSLANAGRGRELGFTTAQYVTAVAMSLVAFVMLANLVVDRYEQGALRAAVDEGARAGADVDASSADCERRGHEVVESLLGVGRAHDVRFTCRMVGTSMRATLVADQAAWLPLVPDWPFALTGSAPKEQSP